ncbi:methyltransferase domain-containing protein [Thermanaerosceptrum fracticalcis]|uniref:Methyltransferase domain-containing protein n=1 Tax=Thermanaerosceptrum fracticalcis TaxID=1712410 RepID=A0A7G6E2R2_THEFR|nr:class I SAM-dependent rRNA methyltransferase [Thermanaerosceptrum fracticalcis]QNB46366.1 methyltransferase domain-containing protein [Thermanaerosceptrum fracticalcis]
MAVVHVIEGRQKRIEMGHPWVYKTEIAKIEGEVTGGEIVDVLDFRQRFLGRGFINPRSMLTVRILTQDREEAITEKTIRERIRKAWFFRQRVFQAPEPNACRVIFGEADFLPGLIVDKFGDHLVLQTLALGIAQWQDVIVDELASLIKPVGIYARNDQQVRSIEGLEEYKGCLFGRCQPLVTIEENGLKVYVDIENGQKTGYFLDQKENRRAIKPYVQNARVLDCFCHTGSFALHAAYYGAREVQGLDISPEAIAMAQKNAALNNFTNITFKEANVFDELRTLTEAKEKYDVVILDPPAFTKSKAAVKGAIRGYKEINLRAMKLLPPGGILITNSCSYYMSEDLYLETIADAARDAKRRVRIIELRRQAKDHPMLMGYPESYYLKCFILEVV